MDNEEKVLIQHESTHETITLDPVEFPEEAFEQGKIYSCENFGYTGDFQDDQHICPEQPPLMKMMSKKTSLLMMRIKMTCSKVQVDKIDDLMPKF